MLVFSHDDFLLKDNGPNHPERKERLISIINSIKEIKDYKIDFKEPSKASLDVVSLVHPKSHIKKIFSFQIKVSTTKLTFPCNLTFFITGSNSFKQALASSTSITEI